MGKNSYFIFDFNNLNIETIKTNIKKAKEKYELDFFEFVYEWLDKKDSIISNTSGSTGKTKKIKLLKKYMKKSAYNTINFLDDKTIKKSLLCLPLGHISAKMMVVRSMIMGLKIIVSKPSSKPLDEIYQNIDICSMVPLQVQNSLDKLENIKYLLVGGAPIDMELESKLEMLNTNVFHTYGMTETYSHVAIRIIGKNSKEFKALEDITFNKDKNSCLIINSKDLNIKNLKTNDIIELIDENSFRWIGREDNIINSGGIKIVPELLEEKLKSTIKDNFFISHLNDKLLNQKLILVLEGEERKINFPKNISKHEKPKEVYFVKKIRKTKIGKLKRILNKEDIISMSKI